MNSSDKIQEKINEIFFEKTKDMGPIDHEIAEKIREDIKKSLENKKD